MNTIFLSKTWGRFLQEVFKSPQQYVVWVIVFLIVLFMLSRLRNILEERGVNRAIYISRGLVGTFIAFIVTPVVFYILLNVIALVHGVSTIDISFLAQWIGLTLTSYWWLLECFFSSSNIANAKDIYTVDSIIRIIWILVPLSVIWIRTSKTRLGKLFIIPIIIGVLVITRYKKTNPTFITEDKELVNRIPGLNWFLPDENKTASNEQASQENSMLTPERRQIIALVLVGVIIIGFVVGLYLEYRVAGLLVSLVGLLGFLLMAPHEEERVISEENHEDYHTNVDSLIFRMDSIHIADPENLEVYNLSLKISAVYHARLEEGDMIRFPDSLCTKYESYFYDWCKE